jgi:hypothetical protein
MSRGGRLFGRFGVSRLGFLFRLLGRMFCLGVLHGRGRGFSFLLYRRLNSRQARCFLIGAQAVLLERNRSGSKGQDEKRDQEDRHRTGRKQPRCASSATVSG